MTRDIKSQHLETKLKNKTRLGLLVPNPLGHLTGTFGEEVFEMSNIGLGHIKTT
jgi:hypothetical protein